MAGYEKIKNIPSHVIEVASHGGRGIACSTSSVNPEEVNELVQEGWEIIHVTTHTSLKHDATGVVYTMGLPRMPGKKNDIFTA